MSVHDPWLDRLSEFLDGDLDPVDAKACATHVEGCVECRALLDDLRRLARDAKALPATPPARDLWPGIAARLAPRVDQPEEIVPAGSPAPPRRALLDLGDRTPWWHRRLTLSMPQALAASLLLVAMAGGGTWLALRPAGRPALATAPTVAPETGAAVLPATAGPPTPAIASVDPRYDRTVADLQRLFTTQRAHLDTSTVRILDQNLAIIDRAIADAERAVEADPSNVYLRSHLAATMRRKVDLLRRATVIAGGVG